MYSRAGSRHYTKGVSAGSRNGVAAATAPRVISFGRMFSGATTQTADG